MNRAMRARVLITIVSVLAVVSLLAVNVGEVRAEADCTSLAVEPLPFPGPAARAQVPAATTAGASRVTVQGEAFRYRYTLNGQPEVVRGMGYNPRYERLSVAERRGKLERDFASMAAVGVNTVFGWDPAQFDGLTLDVAAAHGLGVALPFDFDFGLDYASEEVQSRVRSEVLAWVERYRAHPALRMWAIGNETFHKLVPPAWCAQPPADEQASRASAFARFYVDLIDQVNALDPNHPVIYRAAEDSYVSWLREALADGRRRPWFVYGLNVYSPRLKEVLENWDQHGLDAAVLVSEFGPSPEERPAGFQQYWSWIRSHPDSVIGGAVYVWFTEGPEAVDRVYGLVDGQGQAVDGGLATIGELYLGETPAGR